MASVAAYRDEALMSHAVPSQAYRVPAFFSDDWLNDYYDVRQESAHFHASSCWAV